MKNKQDNLHANVGENTIDIIAALKKIWIERKFILKSIISSFIIGCLVALTSPTMYTSQTTFVPQVSGDDMPGNNKLGSLASLAGINLNAAKATSDSYISPLVYTNIIDSEEFSLKLLDEEIIDSNLDKFTVKEYLLPKESLLNFDPIGFIKKYTIGLFLKSQTNSINSDVLDKYNFISSVDYSLLSDLRNKFTIELNAKEGFVKVLATDKNPFISTQLVELVTESLQSKIIEIRTNKIKARLEFSKEQYDLKQKEFNLLVNKLAEFKDSNKNISTAIFLSKLQKLESEYSLQQNILMTLASEYHNNKIKLNKDTPIFSVLDEVSVPTVKSKPDKTVIIFIFMFLGLTLSTVFILAKDNINDIIQKINQ